ncbi:MAG: UDP-3-O-(3-hydroxymyristoyl)glucosamine N-acyltransferase [Elusimicrobia bacterium]|nr:UDP-3-O-(3-hydroxymyristoyl)glucosamine N-acyltransferase [Elusimicrobiota bacterium]
MNKLTAAQIAEITGGELEGDPQVIIRGANSIEKVSENEIAFLEKPQDLNILEKPDAGCVLVPKQAKGKIKNFKGTLIYVDNPKWAFVLALRKMESETKASNPPAGGTGIHPTAVIEPRANIGKNAVIGPYCVIGSDSVIEDGVIMEAHCCVGANSKIGSGSRLYPAVVIRENCEIGRNVIIHAGAVIGSDGYGYIKIKEKHEKVPQIGRVVVEDEVEIGSLAAVDRAALGETVIGRGTKIDNLVHIAHNVKIGKNCLILAQAGISGSTRIGDNVIIAGQAGLADHIEIGDNSIVMAQSGVISGLEKGSMVFGTPARPRKEFFRLEALISKLPEIYELFRKLRKSSLPK